MHNISHSIYSMAFANTLKKKLSFWQFFMFPPLINVSFLPHDNEIFHASMTQREREGEREGARRLLIDNKTHKKLDVAVHDDNFCVLCTAIIHAFKRRWISQLINRDCRLIEYTWNFYLIAVLYCLTTSLNRRMEYSTLMMMFMLHVLVIIVVVIVV